MSLSSVRRAAGLAVLLFVGSPVFGDVSPYFGTFPPAQPSEASHQPAGLDWYKDEVFYHIWMHAFADSDGNGVGDLPGIVGRLDDLKDLGVTSLWLSPFWTSPSTHGYDVVDYTTVDPRYGTNDDLKTLLKAAHSRGMKVIFDFVPNHVSARNPWFTDSRDGKNGRRNWFLWREKAPSSGWLDFSGKPGWHAVRGRQSYYALFWDQMPDLNYREPAVRQEMARVIADWLNFGFDGMRIDAVKYLFENETSGANSDQPETLEFFRKLRKEVVDPYAALGYPKVMVGENWTDSVESLVSYLSSDGKTNDGLHATLEFPFGTTVTTILNGTGTVEGEWGRLYENLVAPIAGAGGWTFTFLSNHDNYQSRPATLYAPAAKVKVAQALQMTAWGTPVLYYGNEIGMTGANGNDGNMRKTFPWKALEEAKADPESLWNWQAALNRLRLAHPALRRGDLRLLTATPDLAAVFARTLGADRVVVVLNLTDESLDEVTVPLGDLSKGPLTSLAGDPSAASLDGGALSIRGLEPYGVRIFQLGAGAALTP